MNILPGKEYAGVIVPATVPNYYDPNYRGRYRVHIAELMPHMAEDEGIWCRNHTHKNRMTHSDVGTYGSYTPLHAGTKVIIKFFENDHQSGYIDRVISDYEENTTWEAQDSEEPYGAPEDRDEQYIIFKTPKKWSTMYVNEDTSKEPNTMYLIFNRDNTPQRRTVIRIDESGIHTWTRDNNRVKIFLDDNKEVDGNQTEHIKGYRTKHVDMDEDFWGHMNRREQVDMDDHETILMNKYRLVTLNENETISGNRFKTVTLNDNETVVGNKLEAVNGLQDYSGIKPFTRATFDASFWSAKGPSSFFAMSTISIDGGAVFINSGMGFFKPAAPPIPPIPPMPPKAYTAVRDLGPQETPEYDFADGDVAGRPVVTGDKCEDATKNYVPPGGNPAGGAS